MSFAKAVMVTSITTILKGFRPLMDSMTLRVLAKMFAISMATVKCIVASTTCMAQPSILMKRLVFKPKTSSSRFADGRTRCFIPDTGNLAVNRFAQNPENKAWYYLDSNGYAVTGLQTINGKQYYFDNEGRQVKGHFVTINNQRYFLDGDSGEIARSRFVTENNKWYYVDGNGKLVKGAQVINGNHYYFNNDYSQVKGAWANGRYYDGDSGQAVTNRFVQVGANKWAYLNQNGQKVVGLQHINGKLYYFEGNGVQAKGKLLTYRGKKYYFDANSGEAVTNRFIQVSRGVWYCFNASGQAVTGEQVINGQHLYFDASGRQVKGRYVWVKGQRRYL